MEDGRYDRSMLLDFYGELLTDKQRECFDLHYNEDLSLSEIAEQLGISRQGVWDNIRRAEELMQKFESKTGLIGTARESRRRLTELKATLTELTAETSGRAKELSEAALRETEALLAEMGAADE